MGTPAATGLGQEIPVGAVLVVQRYYYPGPLLAVEVVVQRHGGEGRQGRVEDARHGAVRRLVLQRRSCSVMGVDSTVLTYSVDLTRSL